jgi:transketolase
VTKPDVILMGTGSEVQYCVAAAETLTKQGAPSASSRCPVGSCSKPSRRSTVTPCCLLRSARGSPSKRAHPSAGTGWAGPKGRLITLDRFGASAPGPEVAKQLGFTAEHVVQVALEVLG